MMRDRAGSGRETRESLNGSGREPGQDDDANGFRLFAVLTAVAALILFSERHFIPEINRGIVPMPVLVPVALGVVMAWRPSSIAVCLGFWATYTYFLYLGFPQNNTNQTLTFFVGLAVLGSAAVCMRRARTWRISGADLFREFAPVVRLSVVGLYFWTIWHKLNTDFFDPDVSCASRMSADLFKGFGIDTFPMPSARRPLR